MNIFKERVVGFLQNLYNWLKKPMLFHRTKDVIAKNSPIFRDELLALIVFALSLMTILSIVSFDEFDHARSQLTDQFKNWLGPTGAFLSFRLLKYFGIAAIYFPCMGFYLTTTLLFGERYVVKSHRLWGSLIVLLGFMPMIGHIYQVPIRSSFLIGGEFAEGLRAITALYISSVGLFIVFLTILMGGILVLLGRPYLAKTARYFFASLKKSQRKPEKKRQPLIVLRPLEARPSVPTILPPKEVLLPLVLSPKEIEPPLVRPPVIENAPALEMDIQIVERDRALSISMIKKVERESVKKEPSFVLPPLNLLDYDAPDSRAIDPALLKKEADKLQRAFLQYGIEGKIREIRPGPVVTNYEFVPMPGIKLSRIAALSDDIAMAMSAVQVRIVTPIPGKGAVGIEVPNERRETVYLKEIVADARFRSDPHPLWMAIGKDVEGNPYFMNLADMPHILIAGTTGSGKSVSVNAMICSILYRSTPHDVRFLMIDPKMLELSIYSGIPHLLLPPIIDSKKAANALKWAVKEMDQRYALMKETGVRDIVTYNKKIKSMPKEALKEIEGRSHEHLPYIVIVVDEYADLLAIAGKEVEGYIMRLAQKARACGIHVMLATQRPSVDVITGVIKANFPVRMGFRLASSHDSKTIINKTGAERLLGKGDVLIMPPGTSDLFRVHGAFISEKELSGVVEFLSRQKAPDYRNEIANFEDGVKRRGRRVPRRK